MRSYKTAKYRPKEDDYKIFDDLVSLQEAAKIFHFSNKTVLGWCVAGRVVGQLFGRSWVVSVASVRAYLHSREK